MQSCTHARSFWYPSQQKYERAQMMVSQQYVKEKRTLNNMQRELAKNTFVTHPFYGLSFKVEKEEDIYTPLKTKKSKFFFTELKDPKGDVVNDIKTIKNLIFKHYKKKFKVRTTDENTENLFVENLTKMLNEILSCLGQKTDRQKQQETESKHLILIHYIV